MLGLAFNRLALYHWYISSASLLSFRVVYLRTDRSEAGRHPLSCSFHLLCASCSLSLFLLESKKELETFKDVSLHPYSFNFCISSA